MERRGTEPKTFFIDGIPAAEWGAPAGRVYICVHGKMGSKEDAGRFAETVDCTGWQTLSFDLPGHGARRESADACVPWRAVPELKQVLAHARARWDTVALRAESIGAYFSLLAFAEEKFENCLFVSPLLDMKRLIERMMTWEGVTEERLRREEIVPTASGETLSWEYRVFAAEHSVVRWDSPTAILYAGRDMLIERETVDAFAARFGCRLTVMEDGEHWFHTPQQLAVLDRWTKENI